MLEDARFTVYEDEREVLEHMLVHEVCKSNNEGKEVLMKETNYQDFDQTHRFACQKTLTNLA